MEKSSEIELFGNAEWFAERARAELQGRSSTTGSTPFWPSPNRAGTAPVPFQVSRFRGRVVKPFDTEALLRIGAA